MLRRRCLLWLLATLLPSGWLLCNAQNYFEENYKNYINSSESESSDSVTLHYLDLAIASIDSLTADTRYGDLYYEKGKLAYQYDLVDSALDLFFEASRHYELVGDSCKNRKALYNIGAVLSTMGNSYAALSYYQKSYSHLDCEEDNNSLVLYHFNLGFLFKDLELYDDAMKHFHWVIDNANDTERGRYFATVADQTIHWHQHHTGNTEEAIIAQKRILDNLDLSFNTEDIYNYGYSELGSYYLKLKQFDSAKIYFDKAAEISEALQYPEYQLHDILYKADLYKEMGQLNKAKAYGDSALHFARNNFYPPWEMDALRRLVKIHKQQGDWEGAFKHELMYRNIKDSIQTEKTKFAYLVNELEQELSANLTLGRNYHRAKKEVSERTQALMLLGVLLLVFSILLLVIIGQHRRLRVLNEQLTAINLNKDKIIATLSHDVRTPLVGVEGILDLLRKDMISAEEKSLALGKLENQLDRLKLNIDSLVSWSLHQLKFQKTTKKALSVSNLFDNVIAYANDFAVKNDVNLISDLTDESLTVNVDQDHINVIIRNLISNAIKFSKPGSDVILLGQPANDGTEIQVTDFGSGMTSDQINRLFSADAQTDPKRHDGFGLGLRLVKEYVERNDGSISVESIRGKGTTFTLHFKN
jgi:signal transduction histidine kinase